MMISYTKPFSYLVVFFVIILPFLPIISSVANMVDYRTENNGKNGNHDLHFQYSMKNSELTVNRLIVLSESWDKLFLNMSIQNFGEAIDSIFISVKINEVITECTFSSYKRVGLKNCLMYQFAQPQILIIPLNFTYQEVLSISISIYLDALISWREVEYNFTIYSANLQGHNLLQPFTEQPLHILSNNFHYILQSSPSSLFGQRLFVRGFVPVDIPPKFLLSTQLEVQITGADLEHISLGTGSNINYEINERFTRINSSVSSNDLTDHLWSLKLYIIPIMNNPNDYSSITISLKARGVLIADHFSDADLGLISHPIPGIIMIPILIFFLFGVPYYHVYQEELTEKVDRLLETEIGKN